MRRTPAYSVVLFAGLLALTVPTPTPAADPALPAGELSTILRELLLPALPQPLAKSETGWDHREKTFVGLKWKKGSGILLKPEPQYKMHNSGIWRRIHADALNPTDNLKLAVSDVLAPEPGVLTFSLNLALPVRVFFEQQFWNAGTRLYSGETRARVKIGLRLKCRMSMSSVAVKGSFLPDLVLRFQVVEAVCGYDDLVVEHTAGVGGEVAGLLGDAFIDALRQWKPSIERKMIEKANRTIVKAADTKEVHLKLSRLLGGK